MLDATFHMLCQHLSGSGCVPPQAQSSKRHVRARRDLATIAQGDHLISKIFVENRRVVSISILEPHAEIRA